MAYDAHLADRVRSILQRDGEFSERKMFGGLTFMVNDRMCCGVVKDDLALRLTPEQAAESLRQPNTRIMDFTGKPMNSMIYISAAGIDSDEVLEKWVQSAVKVARAEAARAKTRKWPRGQTTSSPNNRH